MKKQSLVATEWEFVQMERLSYAQMIAELETELSRSNFVRVGGEIFVGAESMTASPWIAFSGDNFSFHPLLGVFSKSVSKIVGKALKKAVPGFRKSRAPVPLFRMTPERISPNDPRIIRFRTVVAGYDPNEVSGFIEWLREVGYAYLAQHSTIKSALKVALTWNRGDQAQQYYIPALLLLLGRRNEMEAYVNEVIGTFDPRADAVASAYVRYIRELNLTSNMN